MDKFKVLVMYSGVIDMPANVKEDRDAISGVSIEYYFYGDGEMVEPKISADGVSGTRRGKAFMDSALANKISYVPGIYDGTFEMAVDSKGKATLKMVDLDFDAPARIVVEQSDKQKNSK